MTTDKPRLRAVGSNGAGENTPPTIAEFLESLDTAIADLEETAHCIEVVVFHVDEADGKVRCLDVLRRHLIGDVEAVREAHTIAHRSVQ